DRLILPGLPQDPTITCGKSCADYAQKPRKIPPGDKVITLRFVRKILTPFRGLIRGVVIIAHKNSACADAASLMPFGKVFVGSKPGAAWLVPPSAPVKRSACAPAPVPVFGSSVE